MQRSEATERVEHDREGTLRLTVDVAGRRLVYTGTDIDAIRFVESTR